MPVYPCPECGAQLRPANPVPAGKKIRCPKCETVFAPAGKSAKAVPTVQAAVEPEVERYGLVKEVEEQGDATKGAFDPIKNRFELSARGPALIQTVAPSTLLLATGCLTCVMAIAGAMWAIWPMIFKVEIVQPEDKMAKFRGPQNEQRKFKELNDDEWRERWLFLGGFVFQFVWGAVICAGASKMHTLEAYPFAMIASIMAFVGPFVPIGIWLLDYAISENDTVWILPAILALALPGIPACFWCVATLRNKAVIAGFNEEKPEDF